MGLIKDAKINCIDNILEYIVIGNVIWQHFEQYTQHHGYMLLGIAMGKTLWTM